MKKLIVEELESRNLLSIAGFGHPANHGFESKRVDTESFFSSSRSSFDFGRRERLSNDFNPRPSRNDVGTGGFDFNPGISMVEVTVEIVIVVPAQAAESVNVANGPVFRSSVIREETSSSLNLPVASISLPYRQPRSNSQRFAGRDFRRRCADDR